jgi:hypothetical protein
MEFTATESGFENGMGGASSAAGKDYHYVLFGRDPEDHSVYFEFDDQIHGSFGAVTRVVIAEQSVEFELKDHQTIVVRRGMGQPQWNRFLQGINDAFGADIVQKA